MTRELGDSGTGWLGDIPTDWSVVPARAMFGERKQKSSATDVHLTPSQKYGVLPQVEYMDITGNKVVLNLSGADNMRHVEAGDYVSHLRSFQGGLEFAGMPGKVSAAYTVLKPKVAIEPRFFKYLFKSDLYIQALQTTTDQLRDGQSIRYGQFALIPLPRPAIEEQRAIADYLDRETAQIDAFIAKNEELITLLTERRAAFIARSVSRCVRDGAPLKSSGTAWAAEVPSHWQVGNIRRFASMKTGHTPSRQNPEYWIDCDIPWFTLADVWQLRQGRRDMDETSEKISPLGLANSAAELLPAGTVALSRTASVGFAGIMPVDMATSQDFWNWVPGGELLSAYLWYQFQAMKPEFERLMTGSTHRTIYQADAASFTIIVPPLGEQHEIVERLDSITKRIDGAIAVAHRGVALARERRAALISAAVTGKIEVGATR